MRKRAKNVSFPPSPPSPFRLGDDSASEALLPVELELRHVPGPPEQVVHVQVRHGQGQAPPRLPGQDLQARRWSSSALPVDLATVTAFTTASIPTSSLTTPPPITIKHHHHLHNCQHMYQRHHHLYSSIFTIFNIITFPFVNICINVTISSSSSNVTVNVTIFATADLATLFLTTTCPTTYCT